MTVTPRIDPSGLGAGGAAGLLSAALMSAVAVDVAAPAPPGELAIARRAGHR